jgi:hypothetical protein
MSSSPAKKSTVTPAQRDANGAPHPTPARGNGDSRGPVPNPQNGDARRIP